MRILTAAFAGICCLTAAMSHANTKVPNTFSVREQLNNVLFTCANPAYIQAAELHADYGEFAIQSRHPKKWTDIVSTIEQSCSKSPYLGIVSTANKTFTHTQAITINKQAALLVTVKLYNGETTNAQDTIARQSLPSGVAGKTINFAFVMRNEDYSVYPELLYFSHDLKKLGLSPDKLATLDDQFLPSASEAELKDNRTAVTFAKQRIGELLTLNFYGANIKVQTEEFNANYGFFPIITKKTPNQSHATIKEIQDMLNRLVSNDRYLGLFDDQRFIKFSQFTSPNPEYGSVLLATIKLFDGKTTGLEKYKVSQKHIITPAVQGKTIVFAVAEKINKQGDTIDYPSFYKKADLIKLGTPQDQLPTLADIYFEKIDGLKPIHRFTANSVKENLIDTRTRLNDVIHHCALSAFAQTSEFHADIGEFPDITSNHDVQKRRAKPLISYLSQQCDQSLYTQAISSTNPQLIEGKVVTMSQPQYESAFVFKVRLTNANPSNSTPSSKPKQAIASDVNGQTLVFATVAMTNKAKDTVIGYKYIAMPDELAALGLDKIFKPTVTGQFIPSQSESWVSDAESDITPFKSFFSSFEE